MNPLADDIRRRIAADGPMPFVEFMRLALYHPEHGYYATRTPGRGADFETAPTLSRAFGWCIARALEEMREMLSETGSFTVTEWGAGNGALAASVFEGADRALRDVLRWRIVERSPAVEEMQRERLDGLPVTWGAGDPVIGCVLANEVVDCFPVHLLRVASGGLRAARVHDSPGGFALTFDGEVPADVEVYVKRYAGTLPDGHVLEVASGIDSWIREAAGCLERGYLLVVDYGDEAPALYRSRPAGTLLAYRDGRPSDDVVAEPGLRDITAHVNFTALSDAASGAGFNQVSITTQRKFLLRYGLRDYLDDLRDRSVDAHGEEGLRLLSERSSAALLVRQGGLGDFRVIVGAKDAPGLRSFL